jgi:CheY-like chemotaxis protein
MGFLVHRLLERKGHRVTTCSSGVQALERLEDSGLAFTLCIMDHNMPGMSGLALARKIKARWPLLPWHKPHREFTDPEKRSKSACSFASAPPWHAPGQHGLHHRRD